MKKNHILILLVGMVLSFSVSAQDLAAPVPTSFGETGFSTPEGGMRSGLTLFKNGDFERSLYVFREITLDSDSSDFHGSAYFWIAKCYLAMGNWEFAEDNLHFFLEDFPGHPFYEEGVYQNGRLAFQQTRYEEAITIFYDFIERYPESEYVPNSYFWVAESLYHLGHYPEAEKIYYSIIEEYPTSYKIEAAKYKISLIDLFDREEVLLDLLKLSHEEYITSLEEFQRRERTYEHALGVYQRRILELNEQMEQERASARAAEESQTAPAAAAEIESAGTETNSLSQLLELKKQVLEMKEFYIDLLEKQYQEGM